MSAREIVDQGVMLRKANDWRYEKEWRHFGPRGLASSPFEMEEVIFGTRCPPSVKHAIRKSLEGRDREVQFFQMCEVPGDFRLRRRKLDAEDMRSEPRRSLTLIEAFSPISSIEKGVDADAQLPSN